MSLTVQALLDRSRKELLDLSTRNRLLSIPVNSKAARIVQVHDELSEQVFRLLVSEKKSLSFLPGRESTKGDDKTTAESTLDIDDEEIGLPQPEDNEVLVDGTSKRHADLRLQTALSPEGLQRRLLSLHQDSLTTIEEQGVNILYLALGHLQWREADQSDTLRYAPLILVPVELHRKSAGERFYIRWREEDIQENLSLAARLKQDFSMELPPVPDDEDLNLTDYFQSVSEQIGDAKDWEVLPNAITLGFFSFAKFLMYRDLDAVNWNEPESLLNHPSITGLLQDGFPQSDQILTEDTQLDEIIPVSKLDHVVDADSSQTLALEIIREGHSIVIQGPPGTGKSQSITNIIATAVLDGKKVLFVAEKLAALEVVKRRLEKEGLGPLCLELHSNKSNKRAVIEEISRTWKLGRPWRTDLEAILPKLEAYRSTLNKHANLIHERNVPSELSTYKIIGYLVSLGERGREAAHLVIEGCESWTPDERLQRRALLEELAARIQRIGLPSQHPWRGVRRDTILQIDLPVIESAILQLAKCIVELDETSGTLATILARPKTKTLAEAEKERVVAEYVGKTPALDKQALCNGVWDAGIENLGALIRNGEQFATICRRLDKQVTESTWEADLSVSRNHIAAHGKSLLRLLNRDYRAAIAQLRGVLTIDLPKSYSDRVKLLDEIISGQKAYRIIVQRHKLGESAFGEFWHREKSEWDKLRVIIEWYTRHEEAGLGVGFQEMVAKVDDTKKSLQLSELLLQRISSTNHAAYQLQDALKLDMKVTFGTEQLDCIPVDDLAERCKLWLERMEDLSRWNNYHVRAEHGRALGLSPLIEGLQMGNIQASAALDCFDRIYFGQLLRAIIHDKPELAQFDGELHDANVSAFQKLDKDRLDLAKYRVLLAHFERMPPSSGIGQAGIVKAEMERKRGHRTVRKLLRDAGSVVQTIKPVFMMSPLSVAQFLEPGAVEFDVLVIDEASQVQPVDALGAIARCKQIVVVGDHKQLPPTRFFARLTSDSPETDEDEAVETAEAKDIESILGLCCARGLPETMLRWHYRSRHHSLIAVSNHVFYNDRLFIVPSPYSVAAGLGLKFNHIADGVFDSGASRTNRVESKAICRAVVEHARNSPHLSLGVATFSVNQRQAILDELELLRRENPDIEPFFSNHPSEPFFVKNLENVQGDERDVIFISVGYGRNVHGFMAMRFGPLSIEGGERRLNVLISRAKQRCEVFSSITADDIDLERASGRGVAALKTFLSFAQTGNLAVAERTGIDEQSPFEEAVRREIELLGYEVHAQVGIAGFFIDLAIVDKERHGRYILGIECDGAAYHSSRSARDRDRLRQSVLEDHGWIIHRIWSTDWFQRPIEQLRKVAEAIQQAQLTYNDMVTHGVPRKVTREVSPENGIDRETIFGFDDRAFEKLAVPYSEAKFAVPRHFEPHVLRTKEMAEVVLKIVEHEGPIHEDEIVNRVRDLWGLGRAGTRIQEAVAKSIRSLLTSGRCKRVDGFLWTQNVDVPIRNRENVSSSSLRKPDMIPPTEISAAILKLIDLHHGATRNEIPVAVARLFGFKNTSAQLRNVIEANVAILLRRGVVEEKDGMLELADQSKTK